MACSSDVSRLNQTDDDWLQDERGGKVVCSGDLKSIPVEYFSP
jgi:hypothetical protein